jgi:hypothetical protein
MAGSLVTISPGLSRNSDRIFLPLGVCGPSASVSLVSFSAVSSPFTHVLSKLPPVLRARLQPFKPTGHSRNT